MAKRRSKRKATVLESLLEGVAASAIPKRVPLGFVCGYPLNGGELYGGSMFIKSAANDTLQGKAIQAVNEKWGEDFRQWGGHETIGIPVCKKKYSPFSFKIVRHETEDSDCSDDEEEQQQQKRRRPRFEVVVDRRFGCKLHSCCRKNVIEKYGVRKGWEPFGQWSMKKALELARKETERLNQRSEVSGSSSASSDCNTSSSEDWTSSDDERISNNNSLLSMCNNGTCTWKVKAKYDNIYAEVTGRSESDDEE
ncbi:expressed unknown protein [Seminavis robusta]|uniref:Uncharacterized protein n=1 Tax=Seminavis robusta TaxID=568900 RepID=A0A9N8E183_9STRA|nr:expressed unknown protein [Seminavis robusta]|eukprot:Sro546_g164070.1 n/a (252) ;mRNA; f:28669-29916